MASVTAPLPRAATPQTLCNASARAMFPPLLLAPACWLPPRSLRSQAASRSLKGSVARVSWARCCSRAICLVAPPAPTTTTHLGREPAQGNLPHLSCGRVQQQHAQGIRGNGPTLTDRMRLLRALCGYQPFWAEQLAAGRGSGHVVRTGSHVGSHGAASQQGCAGARAHRHGKPDRRHRTIQCAGGCGCHVAPAQHQGSGGSRGRRQRWGHQ
ncbi:hypothetical protein V8C86DRAFT_3139539 [Haematococcus lacustris]